MIGQIKKKIWELKEIQTLNGKEFKIVIRKVKGFSTQKKVNNG